MRPVKIAYLVSQYPAPSHTYIRREIWALRRQGLCVESCSIRLAESQSEVDRAEEARTFYVLRASWLQLVRDLLTTFLRRPTRWLTTLVATVRHRLPGTRSLLTSCAYFMEAMRLAVELERRGITHLHNHFANPASHVGMAVSRYLGIGWSMSLHGLGDLTGPTLPLLAEKVAACRFVVSVTHYGISQIQCHTYPNDWRKVHVVRCGIDVGALPTVRRRRPAPNQAVTILSVGRLSPEKGQLGLIEAFGKAAERGLSAKLVLIGGGPDEEAIRQAIAARRLGDRVELRGPQPEPSVLEAMAEAQLFVLSSLIEGLPVVLMEALALELPVIAPSITGIPELVVHDQTGLLFAAGDWDGLAERILTLAGDPALRDRLGAAGKARVLAEFEVARAVEPLARLFDECHGRVKPAIAANRRPAAVR
jgi:colanic acid/amylovoran biosynthesis glycosyltransferase